MTCSRSGSHHLPDTLPPNSRFVLWLTFCTTIALPGAPWPRKYPTRIGPGREPSIHEAVWGYRVECIHLNSLHSEGPDATFRNPLLCHLREIGGVTRTQFLPYELRGRAWIESQPELVFECACQPSIHGVLHAHVQGGSHAKIVQG